MIYRSLTADDYGVFRAIRLEALSRHPSSFLTTFDEEHIRPKAVTVEWLDSGAVLGAFEAKDLCAILSVDPERHPAVCHRGWIHAVYVRSDWRRGPVASGLFEYATSNARADGLLQLELYVEADNTRALRFYERAGFELCGRILRAARFADGFQDDLHYCHRLDSTAKPDC